MGTHLFGISLHFEKFERGFFHVKRNLAFKKKLGNDFIGYLRMGLSQSNRLYVLKRQVRRMTKMKSKGMRIHFRP